MTETKIEIVEIATLIPHPSNAVYNRYSSDEFTQSIQRIGIVEPIVVSSATNRIISGHRRYNALIECGIKEAPVRYITVTEEEEDLFLVTYNMYREKTLEEKLQEVELIKNTIKYNKGAKEKVFQNFNLEIKDDKTTRQILCSIVGFSEAYLSRLEKIKQFAPKMIGLIDRGEMTVNKAYLEIIGAGKKRASKDPGSNNQLFCHDCKYKDL